MRYVREGELLYVLWKDKRTVTALNTVHGTNDRVITSCHTKQHGQHVMLQVPKPLAFEVYNQHTGGVDIFDQMVASYRVLRKGRKWWETLSFDFVDIAVVNSFLLYQEYQAGAPDGDVALLKLTHLEFRERLARQLAGYIQPNEEIPRAAVGRLKAKADDAVDIHQELWALTKDITVWCAGACTMCKGRHATSVTTVSSVMARKCSAVCLWSK